MVHLTGLLNIDCQMKNNTCAHVCFDVGGKFVKGGWGVGQRGKFPKGNIWVGVCVVLLRPAKRVAPLVC